jgi:hypothetical protein
MARASSWKDLELAAPRLATEGRRLLYARGDGEAFLATVRDDAAPRVHPINVGIVDGTLYAFIGRSPKQVDLLQDGRFAIHSHQDPAQPDELELRGRARLVEDGAERAAVASVWFFEPDETYALFAFDIEAAILGERAADEWPPRYSRWPERPAN